MLSSSIRYKEPLMKEERQMEIRFQNEFISSLLIFRLIFKGCFEFFIVKQCHHVANSNIQLRIMHNTLGNKYVLIQILIIQYYLWKTEEPSTRQALNLSQKSQNRIVNTSSHSLPWQSQPPRLFVPSQRTLFREGLTSTFLSLSASTLTLAL